MKFLLKVIGVLLVVSVVVAAGGAVVALTQLQPVNSTKTEQVSFVIPKGQPISTIGKRLQEAGLIRNALAFRFVVWQKSLANQVQAGTFQLTPAMSTSEVAEQLTKGTNDVWVTVLEGWRVEEIADMLAEQELTAFDKTEFMELAKADEGYLFPDTYLLPREATAASIHSLMKNTFEKKVEKGLATEIENSPRKLSDVIILASIVEREARGSQMPVVAGILWNRIDAGMGLNADATLQFGN